MEMEKIANFGEILSDLPKIWLIYMLIDKTIYAKKRVKWIRWWGR